MIENVSRRTLVILAGVGFTLVALGWMDAWKQRHAVAEIQAQQSGGPATKSRNRTARAEKTGMELSDPQSNHLLRMIEEMEKSNRPGEPNPQFAKVAKTALADANFQRRLLNFHLLMDHLRPEDAREMHELFVEAERAGRPFAEEYASFSVRWGAIDGAGAMAFWAAREPFDMKESDLSCVMSGWGNTDPDAALAWLASHGEMLHGMNVYNSVTNGWINKDQAAATQWLTDQSDTGLPINRCLQDMMINVLYSDGIQSASQWLAGLPDTEKLAAAARDGWNNNQYRFQNLDPEQASAAWSAVGNEKWMGVGEFERFCGTVANANGGSLDGFMDSLAKKWPAAKVSAQFERWAGENPDRVLTLLKTIPPSAVRTAGINGALKTLGKSYPTLVPGVQQMLAPEQ